MTLAEPAIQMNDVHFTYDEGTCALRGVSLEARRGEFVALLGSNGSGKTTLMKLLVGLLAPGRGEIRVGGKSVSRIKRRDHYEQVGLVFQNPNDQLFAATVEEDVAFGPRNLGLSDPEVVRRVEESLRSVSALALRHRAIHHLSFGQQKRVSLAGVLAMRPSILVLDEPTAGLDPSGEAEMMALLARLNRQAGITILLATHSVDMLPLFADRIYVLDRGKVLIDGPSRDVFCRQEMIERAKLRLPYVSSLLDQMRRFDGVPIDGLPLTIGEARQQLLELIPKELIAGTIEQGSV